MNKIITYISSKTSNDIQCLQTNLLSAYILSDDEKQYINTLSSEIESVVSSSILAASSKIESSMNTQPELDKLYARKDNEQFSESDLNNLKNFINTKLVGNEIVSFSEL